MEKVMKSHGISKTQNFECEHKFLPKGVVDTAREIKGVGFKGIGAAKEKRQKSASE